MSTTKNALLITRNFPPLVGGMERLVHHVVSELEDEYTFTVVGPKGCDKYLSGHRTHTCPLSPVALFLACGLFKAVSACRRTRHQVCIAGSGVTAPIAVIAGRLSGMPVVTYIHGLDLVVGNYIYQRLFLPMIRRSDRLVVNSSNTARLAVEHGIDPDRISIIHPGVDTEHAEPPPAGFRETYGLSGRKVLLYVGRIIPRKGLPEFIDRCMPEIARRRPDVILIVAGSEAGNALKKDVSIMDRIHEAIGRHRLEDHVRLIGRIDDETLQAAYEESDLCVFPLRETAGDVEGFGMVAVEAASHGLPTVAFAVGGIVDAIADRESGLLVKPDDHAAMTNVILRYLAGNHMGITTDACRRFAARFSWKSFGQQMKRLLIDLGPARCRK